MSAIGEPPRVCAACGAVASVGASTCWLCGATMHEKVEARGVKPVGVGHSVGGRPGAEATSPWSADDASRAEERAGGGFSYSLSTLLLVMTLAAVMCGLLAVAPGLGIPACIVLGPVLVRTSMVVRRREAAGLAVSGPEKIGLAVGSFLTVSMIIGVVIVAAVGTFCGICLGIYSVAGEKSANAASVVAFLAAGIVTLGIVAAFAKLIKARFRRDVGLPLMDGAAAPSRRWYWIFPWRGANFFLAIVLVGLIAWGVQESMSGPYFDPLPMLIGAVVAIGVLALYFVGRKSRGGKQ